MKTIFDDKYTMASMEDLKDCGIWSHLWLQATMNGFIKPMAFYVLLDEEKKLQIVFTLKTPIGYVLSLNSRV